MVRSPVVIALVLVRWCGMEWNGLGVARKLYCFFRILVFFRNYTRDFVVATGVKRPRNAIFLVIDKFDEFPHLIRLRDSTEPF